MTATDHGQRALGGLRVLDLTNEMAGFATKLLADMGADVIKVEPPGGDPTRRLGPLVEGVPAAEDPERSLRFMHDNTNKRSITLDLEGDAGQAAFRRLAETAELIVESQPLGYLESIGLGFEALRQANPALVFTSVSGFGQSGPYAQFKAPDIVCYAMSGLMYITGVPETPPVQAHGNQSFQIASLYAALGSMCALHHSRATGKGQYIDVSAQASAATFTRLVTTYLSSGVVRQRHGSRDFFSYPCEAFPCKDGWAMIVVVSPQEWPRLASWMASEGMAGDLVDERYEDNDFRREHYDHVHDLIEAWTRTHTTDELFEGGQARRLAFGKVFDVADALENTHLRERGFFVDVEHPELATTFTYPGPPYLLSETPWSIRRRSPLLGEDNHDVLEDELGLAGAELAAAIGDGNAREPSVSAPASSTSAPRPASRENGDVSTQTQPPPGPLADITIADFSWVWAGPLATRLLGDFGAEVIKVERPEARQLALARRASFGPKAVGLMVGSLNRNKYSITANLKDPRGMEVARRIVERSDVVVDNFSAGTMTRLGLGYEQLREIKPDIIALSLSGFGQTGPWSDFMSYGPTLQALSGLIDLTGFPDGPGAGVGEAFPDPTGGLHGALSILIALEHRRRTGRGQFIDIGQIQTTSAMLGTAVLDYTVNGHRQQRRGNRLDDRPAAPHGVYPCRGDDRWCVIAVFSDEQWQAFRDAIGDPPWTHEPALATALGRTKRRDDLDSHVAAWTRDRTSDDVMETLQAAGVPAGAVRDSRDAYETDKQLKHRGFWMEAEHPELGRITLDGLPAELSDTPATVRRFAPLPGDDNAYVLGQLLGLPSTQIEELAQAGVF